MILKLIRCKKGAALLEYSLLAAGVSLVAAAGVAVFGHKTSDMISSVAAIMPGAHADDNGPIASGKIIETTGADTGQIGIDITTILFIDTPAFTNSATRFDPGTGGLVGTASFNTERALHGQVTLPNGDALIAPSVTARLLENFSDAISEPPQQPIEPLTTREEEVLVTVAGGRTNAEIAEELHISLSTVKTHLASLMAKLGARNRVEIAMWAYETGRL